MRFTPAYPDALLELSPPEQEAVLLSLPRFSRARILYWWSLIPVLLGSPAASLSYAWYRASGYPGFRLPMLGFTFFWMGGLWLLAHRFIYRPAWNKAMERALTDFSERRKKAANREQS